MRLILLIAALYIVAVPGTAAAAPQQDGKMVLVANLTADQYLREQIDKVFVRLGDHALSADERAETDRRRSLHLHGPALGGPETGQGDVDALMALDQSAIDALFD